MRLTSVHRDSATMKAHYRFITSPTRKEEPPSKRSATLERSFDSNGALNVSSAASSERLLLKVSGLMFNRQDRFILVRFLFKIN